MDVIPIEVSFAPMQVSRPFELNFASAMAADVIYKLRKYMFAVALSGTTSKRAAGCT